MSALSPPLEGNEKERNLVLSRLTPSGGVPGATRWAQSTNLQEGMESDRDSRPLNPTRRTHGYKDSASHLCACVKADEPQCTCKSVGRDGGGGGLESGWL